LKESLRKGNVREDTMWTEQYIVNCVRVHGLEKEQ